MTDQALVRANEAACRWYDEHGWRYGSQYPAPGAIAAAVQAALDELKANPS